MASLDLAREIGGEEEGEGRGRGGIMGEGGHPPYF